MKKKILIFTLIFLVLFSISSVCASDANDTKVASVDVSQIELATTDNNDLEITEENGQAKVENDFSVAGDTLAQGKEIDNKLGENNFTGTLIVAGENASYSTPTVSKNLGYYPIMFFSNDTFPTPLTNKTLSIEFNNIKTKINTTWGFVNYIIPNDTVAGTYTINITFDGDDTYLKSNFATIIDIYDEKTSIIAVEDVSYSRALVIQGVGYYPFVLSTNSTIPVLLANRTVTVTFNDKNEEIVTDEFGLINYVIDSDTPAGTYDLKITYAGEDGYMKSDFTANVEIYDQGTKSIAVENVSYSRALVIQGVGYYPFVLSTNSTIPVLLANRTVTVTFNDKSEEIKTDEFGLINYVIDSDTPVGTYDLKITYAGEDGYVGTNFTASIDVYDMETQIIAADNAAYSYSEIVEGNATYRLLLTTDSLIPIPISNKTVYIEINGIGGNFTTNLMGMIAYTLPELSVGNYSMSMVFKEDGGYATSNKTAKVTIKKSDSTLAVNDITFDYEASGSTTVSITGATGVKAQVVNQPKAVVNINGNNITVSNLDAGTYTLKVTTIPDENHNAVTKTANITVNKLKTQMIPSGVTTVYNGGKYVVIILKDENGKRISGEKVTVVLGGKTYTLTTNAKGKAKVSTNGLKPVNKYTAEIAFKGSTNYEKSSTTAKVKVFKAKPKFKYKAATFKKSDKKKKYTIRFLTNQNKAMKYAKVYIKVNKKVYAAKTNKKGFATFKLNKLTKKGKYAAKIIFKGDGYYKKLNRNVKIKVK